MAKYLLTRGNRRLPIDGFRMVKRDGLPPVRQAQTIIFEEGVPVESDLDFESWVEQGVLVRIREAHEPPRPPKPAPAPPTPPAPLLPMPVEAVVEVVKEEAAPEPAPATAPVPDPEPDPEPAMVASVSTPETEPESVISTRPKKSGKNRR